MAARQAPPSRDSPGKNTGVGCHFLLQCIKVKSQSEVAQLCPTGCDPMDCSLPGSSAHGIFQARVLEWGAIAFSREGPQRGSKTLTAALYSFLRKMLLPPTHIRIRCDGPFAICGGCYPLDTPSSSCHLPGPGCVQQYPPHLLYSVFHCLSLSARSDFSAPTNGKWPITVDACARARVCVCVCVGGRSIFQRNECRAAVRVLEPLCGPSFSQNHRWYMKSQGRDSGLCLKVVRCHRKSLSQKLCPDSRRLHTMFHLFDKIFPPPVLFWPN